MARVAGYISKKNVRRWLDNYEALAAGDVIDDGQVRVVNSGPKAADGYSSGKLHKIMLDSAVSGLSPLKRKCVAMKWLRPIKTKDACRILGISYVIFRNRCALALDEIHKQVNGPLANYMALLEAIEDGHEFDKGMVAEVSAAAADSTA